MRVYYMMCINRISGTVELKPVLVEDNESLEVAMDKIEQESQRQIYVWEPIRLDYLPRMLTQIMEASLRLQARNNGR